MKMKTETRGDFFISIIILGAVGVWSAGWRGEEEKTFKEEILLDNLLAMGERGRRGRRRGGLQQQHMVPI